MIYKKKSGVGGKWADKSELFSKGITKAKIVSETNPYPSTFKDSKGNLQDQDVCKVMFEGEQEAVNVSLNGATIDALIDAFGEDSKNWQGHYLGVEIDKLPGKKFPLYLIPDGYTRTEDANGYSVVVKNGTPQASQPSNQPLSLDEPPLEDMPF